MVDAAPLCAKLQLKLLLYSLTVTLLDERNVLPFKPVMCHTEEVCDLFKHIGPTLNF